MGIGGRIMEKETVLEIEFQPVWDKWAWKVTKNKLDPGFEFECLENSNANIIRVCFEFYVDENYLLSAFEKEKLEKLIKAINEKYGIKRRWRANKYEHYHFLGNVFEICESTEMGFVEDIERYQDGNYFRTKEEAEEYRDYIVKKSLEWHEKRDNNE
jgi:conserved domain protein